MPEWMNAIRSNVPPERLREFKSLLRSVKYTQWPLNNYSKLVNYKNHVHFKKYEKR